MKKILSIYLCLASVFVFSQSEVNNMSYEISSSANRSIMNNTSVGSWVSSKVVDKGIEGSEYLYEMWQPKGVITAVDGKQYVVPFMNFNARLNRFAAYLPSKEKKMNGFTQDSTYLFNSSGILKVKLSNKKEFIKFSDKFFEVVFSSKDFSLLKLYKASIKPAQLNPLTHQKIGKDKMLIKYSYYLKKGTLEEFRLKSKTVLNLLENQKAKVKSFIKENKLSLKREKDLVKIFNYYYSLL